MAASMNFRTAVGGFRKEDVVHYIEYMNTKHANQVNQLQTEMEELRAKVAELSEAPDMGEQVATLTSRLQEAEARFSQKEQEKEQLLSQILELTAQRDAAIAQAEAIKAQQAGTAALELDAYRRAEQMERNARLRAEQICQQANATLAQATTQVDSAAMQYKQVAESISTQLIQLQQTLDSSKNALLDAASTMYAIRPEDLSK